MSTAYNRIDENKNDTVLFVSIFLLFLFVVVYIVDILFLKNHFISGIVLTSLVIVNLISCIFSDKFILKRNKVSRLDYKKNRELYRIVENLCIAAGSQIPNLYVSPDLAINVFAVGRNPKKASIIFTDGSLKKLDRMELEGVISHELAHIKNNDILLSTTLAFLLGFVRSIVNLVVKFINALLKLASKVKIVFVIFYFLSLFILLWILILSIVLVIEELILYKIFRKREFLADAEGALLTRYPKGLANALKKIAMDNKFFKTVNPYTAHLYIASPFRDSIEDFYPKLFHSHPPIEERIQILEEMDIERIKCNK